MSWKKQNMNKYEELLEQLTTLTAQVKDLIAANETEEVDGCSERIDQFDESLYHLRANKGYANGVDLLCWMEDTGNGYIAHFPSYSSIKQDNYICMDYAEAEYLRKLLIYIHKEKSQ